MSENWNMELTPRTKFSCAGRIHMFRNVMLTDGHPIWEAALASVTALEKDTMLYKHINMTAGHFIVQPSPWSHSKTWPAAAARVGWSLTKRLLKDGELFLFLCALLFLQVFLWRKDTFLAQDVIPLCVFIWVLEQNKKRIMCIQDEPYHFQNLTQDTAKW